MNDDFHDTICHTDAGDEAHQPRVNRGVIYAMTNFAYFLEKLDSMTEGAGTLLDSSLIYATSCTAWGKVHGVDNWPVLLAGKADGALKGDLPCCANRAKPEQGHVLDSADRGRCGRRDRARQGGRRCG